MPLLTDPKREKFAQLCARGVPLIDAYERAGYRRNTGNATSFRKRPEIARRIEELQLQSQHASEQELTDFIRDSGLSPAYIIKAMLEASQKAVAANRFDVALKGFKDIGGQLFGMFLERKHVTVDSNSVHTQTNTTINIEGLNQALESLVGTSNPRIELEGEAFIIEPQRALLSPEPVRDK